MDASKRPSNIAACSKAVRTGPLLAGDDCARLTLAAEVALALLAELWLEAELWFEGEL